MYLLPGSGTYLGGVQRVGRSDGPAYTQILTSQVKQVHRRNGLIRSLFGFVLDKSIAFVPVRGAALLEFAVLDRTKRFEYTVGRGGRRETLVTLTLCKKENGPCLWSNYNYKYLMTVNVGLESLFVSSLVHWVQIVLCYISKKKKKKYNNNNFLLLIIFFLYKFVYMQS